MATSSSTNNSLKTKKQQKPKRPSNKKSNATDSSPTTSLPNILTTFLSTKPRPYPLSELLTTFKKAGTKADITKTLDNLASKNVLIKKEFNKTILFLGSKEVSNYSEMEIENLKEDLKQKNIIYDEKKDNLKTLKSDINNMCKYPTNTNIIKLVKEKTKEAMENKKRLEDLVGGTVKVSKDDMDNVNKELGKYKKMYRQRMAIFKNIFETVLENVGMRKGELMEEMGLEERNHVIT